MIENKKNIIEWTYIIHGVDHNWMCYKLIKGNELMTHSFMFNTMDKNSVDDVFPFNHTIFSLIFHITTPRIC